MVDVGLGYLLELVFAVYTVSMLASLISVSMAEVLTILAAVVGFAASGALAYFVLSQGVVEQVFSGLMVLDPIGVWGLLIVSMLGFIEAIYSLSYMRREGYVDTNMVRWYYMLFNATMLAMALSVVSNNIVLMWAAIEATTMATALLVGFYETTTSIEAAWKYVIICSVGVGFALFGTVLVYDAGLLSGLNAEQAMTWTGLISASKTLAGDVLVLLKLGILLAVFGYMAKAGLFPLHVWLPDAHAEAPAPISSILSGVIVKCALIVILRYLTLAISVGILDAIAPVLLVSGILSMTIGGLAIIVQKDIKRLFAYSTIDQMGVIAVGAGLASTLGVLASVMHILYHALAKALAFMASGLVIAYMHGMRSIDAIRGLVGKGMKFTAAMLTIAALGIAAIPPGPSFYSKIYLLLASAEHGVLTTILVLAAMLIGEITILYQLLVMVYGGLLEKHPSSKASEIYSEKGMTSCKIACVFIAFLVLALFVLVQPYIQVAGVVTDEIVNPIKFLGGEPSW